MNSKYDHKIIEKGKQKKWDKLGFFTKHDSNKPPFSVILPPPNITGILHLGHALNLYIQDAIIRYKKLTGFDVFFLPGMDHAGIATQARIDAELNSRGILKQDLGRDKFLEFANQWKDSYQEKIRSQWAKIGNSFDFNHERFTLDKYCNKFVNDTFVRMFNDGLIYHGEKGVTWDCKMKTAISNIEIINKKVIQEMYFLKYKSEDNKDFLVVATTRPETLGSDVALAINPKDKRVEQLKDKRFFNPITKKLLPIIISEAVDVNFGSGIMKVSAHSLLDLEIISENNLEVFETIDTNGYTYNLPDKKLNKLTREEARIAFKKKLEKEGLIEKIEEVESNVAFSQRSNTVVEYLVKKQWFVKMKPLASALLDNLKTKGKVRFYPKKFEDNLKQWIENVHDWTISRQLWWGHQIPAWQKGENWKVQVNSPGKGWTRSSDVLDTWFSSALAPVSFLLKEDDNLLKRYFPTNLVVTAHDIIFFWIARMYFQSLYLTKKIPFERVLIHGLIRDEKGKKMSKSHGNGIDPMQLISEYGSDSLRLFLLFNSTPGSDIRFSYEKLRFSWNFLNKLWNIARFIKHFNGKERDDKFFFPWIKYKLFKLEKALEKRMNNYDFSLIFKEIYEFIFTYFSSYYLEFNKYFFNKKNLLFVLKKTLILLHPFAPFITDEIYKRIFNLEILSEEITSQLVFEEALLEVHNSFENVIKLIQFIRNFREKKSLKKTDQLRLKIFRNDLTQEQKMLVEEMLNCSFISNSGEVIEDTNFKLQIEFKKSELIQKKDNIEDRIYFFKKEIERGEKLLKNQGFLEKAPKDLIQKETIKLEKNQEILKNLQDLKDSTVNKE